MELNFTAFLLKLSVVHDKEGLNKAVVGYLAGVKLVLAPVVEVSQLAGQLGYCHQRYAAQLFPDRVYQHALDLVEDEHGWLR